MAVQVGESRDLQLRICVQALLFIQLAVSLRGTHADGPIDPSTDPVVLALTLPGFKTSTPPFYHHSGPMGSYIGGQRTFNRSINYYFGSSGVDFWDTQSGNDIMWGFEGDDQLYGEDGDDMMLGGPGNDTMIAGPGDDTIWGGDGNDTINGDPCGIGSQCIEGFTTFNDHIMGGAGDDLISGYRGDDSIYGDAGNDIITGDAGNDCIRGGDGNDIIAGGTGNDDLRGGNGNDVIYGHCEKTFCKVTQTDLIYGGPGNDTLRGGPGPDNYYVDAKPCGDTDDITLIPSQGDKLYVVAGKDTYGARVVALGFKGLRVQIVRHLVYLFVPECATAVAKFGYDSRIDYKRINSSATIKVVAAMPPDPPNCKPWLPEIVPGVGGYPPIPRKDVLQGSETSDTLYAGPLGSFMFGLKLNDYLQGSPLNDTMLGGFDNDTMYGGAGDDRMSGDNGYDVLWGDAGNDALFGGYNQDWLYGGPGSDFLTGGLNGGSDYFYVDTPPSCARTVDFDVINDFEYNVRFRIAELIILVGNLTRLDQVAQVKAPDGLSVNFTLAGCPKPFLMVKSATQAGQLVPPLGPDQIKFLLPQYVPRGRSQSYRTFCCPGVVSYNRTSWGLPI